MPFIIESIVTTLDGGGALNVAPMGVEWSDAELILQPWRNTATYRNLAASGQAVVNLTDDVRIFAAAAISDPTFPTRPAEVVEGRVLEAACSWREVRVEEREGSVERSRFAAQILHHGFNREFLGFNRARNAVLEAAVLATRTRILPAQEILEGFARLRLIVEKTAGPAERDAMAGLVAHVEAALGMLVPVA